MALDLENRQDLGHFIDSWLDANPIALEDIDGLASQLSTVGREVTTLPSGAKKLDRVSYVWEPTKKLAWDLICLNPETEFPWSVLGGAPLEAETATEGEFAAGETNYKSLTAALAVTAPLKGEYDIGIEARLRAQAASRIGYLSYAIAGVTTTATLDARSIQLYVGTSDASMDLAKRSRLTVAAAATTIEEKARTGGAYLFQWLNRRLWAMPIRVG